MNLADHVAAENVLYLDQGIDLIRRLDDRLFTRGSRGPFRGGVGAQFRHCIDFYDCFLRGLAEGRIDYSERRRDARIETERAHALRATERIRAALIELSVEQVGAAIEVRADEPTPGTAGAGISRSSVLRELQFLVSHTIHHYALIGVLLAAEGFDVSLEFPEFGVAPSTLTHWKETGSLTS